MGGLPKRFPDRDDVTAVRAAAEQLAAGETADSTMRVAGRVMARRDMGKLVFLDVVDRSGRIQVICESSKTGEVDVLLVLGAAWLHPHPAAPGGDRRRDTRARTV